MLTLQFHALGRDNPNGLVEDDFTPSRAPLFARSGGGQSEKLQCSGREAFTLPQIGQPSRGIVQLQGGMVAFVCDLGRGRKQLL